MSSNEEEQPTSSPLNVKFDVVPETLEPSYKEHFPVFVNGLVQGEPGGFVFHPHYAQNANKIYNMKVRSDDVWIRTFPRSGTTWTSELAWLIMNDCNFQEAARVPLTVRSPNIDTHYFTNWDDLAPSEIMNARKCRSVEKLEQMPSPRVLQSHLPFQLLPTRLLNTAKVIYVARNPKDAIVSFFYFHKLVKLCYFSGEMEQFVDYFINNQVCWTPYFFSLLDAWGKRNHPNLLILFYEDMKKDLRSQIEKMASFLDKSLTEKQVEKLLDHVSYLNCAGEMADCQTSHFTPEVSRKIDKWIEKNLEGSDLKFLTDLEE
ncbi:sulfotransferase 1 family member D1-like isoform X7 [Daphnia pulex]|uniref:sulfotransferase 1 family member D1-like isoform X6 n=1 Tax=Daphnia pulex TaxID=6669 RepID=UPI001EE064A9|nr:sulfotransferase 1 family member D1-like isoform X6 [Daphnia pulex]XP_046448154.1 sulfotransferase 1 family member D1-like isoform X7 [Daphnia pulex]